MRGTVMATSPTSSPLGAVADVGRSAASAAAGPVGKSEDADGNPSFSAALSDARGNAGETSAAADAANAKAEKSTVTNASESDAALSTLLLMRGNIVKPATAGGKTLPPDGESLPQPEQIIVATAELPSL